MLDLFDRAWKKDISILSDPQVSKLRDRYNNTPLHYLAAGGKVEILEHPDVAKVKNNGSRTPLHRLCVVFLSIEGKNKILQHPEIAKIRDNEGVTPLHELVYQGEITNFDLKKLFPWYERRKIGLVTMLEINEILNVSNSIKYILD